MRIWFWYTKNTVEDVKLNSKDSFTSRFSKFFEVYLQFLNQYFFHNSKNDICSCKKCAIANIYTQNFN